MGYMDAISDQIGLAIYQTFPGLAGTSHCECGIYITSVHPSPGRAVLPLGKTLLLSEPLASTSPDMARV